MLCKYEFEKLDYGYAYGPDSAEFKKIDYGYAYGPDSAEFGKLDYSYAYRPDSAEFKKLDYGYMYGSASTGSRLIESNSTESGKHTPPNIRRPAVAVARTRSQAFTSRTPKSMRS